MSNFIFLLSIFLPTFVSSSYFFSNNFFVLWHCYSRESNCNITSRPTWGINEVFLIDFDDGVNRNSSFSIKVFSFLLKFPASSTRHTITEAVDYFLFSMLNDYEAIDLFFRPLGGSRTQQRPETQNSHLPHINTSQQPLPRLQREPVRRVTHSDKPTEIYHHHHTLQFYFSRFSNFQLIILVFWITTQLFWFTSRAELVGIKVVSDPKPGLLIHPLVSLILVSSWRTLQQHFCVKSL